MSRYDDGYDDEPARYRTTRTRPRERDEPEYVREETYIERGKGPGPRELVYRGRDDSIEDIPRDFPPPGRGDSYRRDRDYDDYASQAPPRRARSAQGRRHDDYYDDDRYTDYAVPAAAGAAGYAAGRRREKERRHRHRDYDSDYSDSPPRSERKKERRKSGVEEVLGGLGLGGLVGGLLGKKDKDSRDHSSDRSRTSRATSRRRGKSRSGRYSSDESRSRSRGGNKEDQQRKWAQAAQAALVAGAVEAFRSRKEPGPWTGDKGKRIATAALASGGIDGFIDRDPNTKSKRHLAEAVIGGLAANRLANGPRSKSRGAGDRAGSPDSFRSGRSGRGGFRSRSRSVIDRFRGRSQSRGPGEEGQGGGGGMGALKGLAGGAAVAAAGKAIYDRVRSKSRGAKDRKRSPSSSSADSYVPSRNRLRDRARGSPGSDTGTRRSAAGTQDGRDRGRGGDTRSLNNGQNGAAAGAGAGAGAVALRGGGRGNEGGEKRSSSTDSNSTTDMEQKRKHMRGKEFLTAGLATIATVHAAHGVYSSMEAHEKRHRLVAEGEMTPEEARKKQTKAWVQDAAAVGIAALGIKGAFSEWKEMNEQRYVSLDRPSSMKRAAGSCSNIC